MEEIHFVGTHSPTNIYSSCIFHCFGRTSVVVGSRKNVQLISPTTTSVGVLHWVNEDLDLPYFYSEDTIISVNAFVHIQTGLPVIGVCGVRGGGKGFFGIHKGTKSTSKELFYEFERNIIELDFVPLNISHTEVQTPGNISKVFLISGTDNALHVFADEKKLKDYREVPIDNVFPEIVPVASNVMSIDVKFFGTLRIIALGYQNGFIAITVYDENTQNLVSQATKMLDGSISSLKLYCPDSNDEFSSCLSMRNKPHVHPALEDFDKHTQSKRVRDFTPPLYLVIGSALGFVIAFKDILNANLDRWEILPYHQSSDAVTSICVLDWDMDREREVCIGSYGKQVSIFKEYGNTKNFRLAGRFNFPQPIMSILPCHVTQDGVMGLTVSCFSGVHFIRPKITIVKSKIDEGLKLIQEKRSLERLLKEETDKINNLKAQLGVE